MTCLSLWERWPSEARTERALSVTCGDSSPKGRAKRESQEGEPRRESQEGLPLPLGEVAERGEDGEGLPLPMGEVAEHSEDGEGTPKAKRSCKCKTFFYSYFFLRRW